MLFSVLYKIMVNKVTFAGFRGGDRPNRHPLGFTPINPFNVKVVGDSCLLHQPFDSDTNVTAVELKLTEMQENLALKIFVQCNSTLNFRQQVNAQILKDQCTTHFCL